MSNVRRSGFSRDSTAWSQLALFAAKAAPTILQATYRFQQEGTCLESAGPEYGICVKYTYNTYYTEIRYLEGINMVSITALEFQRNIGRYQDAALVEPVCITKHGRERLVLVSAEEFHRLLQRSRQVLHVSELEDDDITLIENSHMSDEHAHLNDELDLNP